MSSSSKLSHLSGIAKEVEHGLITLEQLVEKVVEFYDCDSLLILRLDEQDEFLPGQFSLTSYGIQSYWLETLIETGAYKRDPRLIGIKKSLTSQSWQALFESEKVNTSDFTTCNASVLGLVSMQETQGNKTLCSMGFSQDVHLHEAMPDIDELTGLLHELLLNMDRDRMVSLTDGEKEVFLHAILGKSASETADTLNVSVSFIEEARGSIQTKFEADSFDQAIHVAKKMGFIES